MERTFTVKQIETLEEEIDGKKTGFKRVTRKVIGSGLTFDEAKKLRKEVAKAEIVPDKK
jgi:hypothetical protein